MSRIEQLVIAHEKRKTSQLWYLYTPYTMPTTKCKKCTLWCLCTPYTMSPLTKEEHLIEISNEDFTKT